MLRVVQTMKELPFGQLMQVYSDEYDVQQEQAFYAYLRECFFRTPGAAYYLWYQGSECVSALRLEPWKDGMLVTGLHTAPDHRKRGMAKQLLMAVQERCPERLYSHIHKANTSSVMVHESCGFRKISGIASYLDGSCDHKSATYMFEK